MLVQKGVFGKTDLSLDAWIDGDQYMVLDLAVNTQEKSLVLDNLNFSLDFMIAYEDYELRKEFPYSRTIQDPLTQNWFESVSLGWSKDNKKEMSQSCMLRGTRSNDFACPWQFEPYIWSRDLEHIHFIVRRPLNTFQSLMGLENFKLFADYKLSHSHTDIMDKSPGIAEARFSMWSHVQFDVPYQQYEPFHMDSNKLFELPIHEPDNDRLTFNVESPLLTENYTSSFGKQLLLPQYILPIVLMIVLAGIYFILQKPKKNKPLSIRTVPSQN